jgi:hypothetical protein
MALAVASSFMMPNMALEQTVGSRSLAARLLIAGVRRIARLTS